ncbi:MAG TPA: RluA family pseudouridine synthase [Deltaproteobacteria bacterium]|nr:RluA family pseudouridine synthase [Deltaproteobacteria bacterium]
MISGENFHVETADSGERLDRFLVKKCPELSRSQLKQWIESGHIRLNGQTAKPSHLLKLGETVSLVPPPLQLPQIEAEAIPLDILYEDEDLIVLNKAAELVVHLGAGVKSGTLVNALLHHCKDLSGIGGVARPGIVHRLDKGTSGVLVVAKNDRTHQQLSAQFQSRQVEKTYLAFVWGEPRDLSGTFAQPLGRSSANRKKISSKSSRLREAVTQYRLLKKWGPISLLELHPRTGRTHQLRVHLSEAGHPIVGDPLYGKRHKKDPRLESTLAAWLEERPFQLLHAARLSFRHPTRGLKMDFEAPMREEMLELQKKLGVPS